MSLTDEDLRQIRGLFKTPSFQESVGEVVRAELNSSEGVVAELRRGQLKLLDMVRALDKRQRTSGGTAGKYPMVAREP